MNNSKTFLLSAFLMTSLLSVAYGFSNVGAVSPDVVQGQYSFGPIIGVQDDQQDNATSQNVTWLLFGTWKSNLINQTNSENNNSSGVFDAAIEMIKPDGTAKHTHALSQFVLTNSSDVGNQTSVFNGTSTISMREGPVTQLPTSIRVMNNSTISIWLNPENVENHFDDDTIYGVVLNASDIKPLNLGGQ
jgi:hypothetical protein